MRELTNSEARKINALPLFVSLQCCKNDWVTLIEMVDTNPNAVKEILTLKLIQQGEKQIAKSTAEYMRKAQNV